MKSIVYRGGVLTFRIPIHWRAGYLGIEEATFYGDHPDSGTLRVKITTEATPEQTQVQPARDVLRSVVNELSDEPVKGMAKIREDGNAIFQYERATSGEGISLVSFYWIVVRPLPPNRARVVTFSYTVLAEQKDCAQIRHDLEMLKAEIEALKLSLELNEFES